MKRLVIALLLFGNGIVGNLIAAWIQPDIEGVLGTNRLVGAAIGAVLAIGIAVLLESKRALPLNWRWHRFWYMWELLGNPDLRRWETDFARLELAQGRHKVSSAEVISEGGRRDLIEVLCDVITGRQGWVRRALVLGEPGSGKTTGLERLTIELAREGAHRLGFGHSVPVLVRMGNFQKGELLEYVGQSMRHGTKGGGGKVLSQGIEELVEKGRGVVWFEALGEGVGQGRVAVRGELAGVLERRPFEHVPVVITSRTREDPGGRLAGLPVFEIQDLSNEAVEVFIRAYKQPQHTEGEIKERLERHGLLEPGGLGRNPFWLRLIVESGAFEGNKGQILNDAVGELLAREWDAKPAAERSWKRVFPKDEQLAETQRGLAWLGYRMSVENQVVLNEDQALGKLGEWLAGRVGVEELRPQDVLGLGRDAQILVYEPGPVQFRHRLLQEFMTARALVVEEGLLTADLLEQSVRDTGWWETLIMLVGIADSTMRETLVQQILKTASRQPGSWLEDHGLALAAGCVLVCEVKEEIAQAVLKRYIDKIEREGLRPAIRETAVVLCRVTGETGLEIWTRLLQKRDWSTARLVTEILAQVATPSAARRLIEHGLMPWNEAVQRESLDALIRLGEPAVSPLIEALGWRRGSLGESPWLRFSPVDALAGIGEPAVGPVVHTLKQTIQALENSKDEEKSQRIRMRQIQERVTEALGRIGEPALTSLLTMLADENRALRVSATVALGEVGGKAAVGSLIEALNDEDKEVRAEAANALGKIRDKRAVAPLVALLSDNYYKCAEKAAWALGEIGDEQAVEPLTEGLKRLPWMASSEDRALGKICDPRAIEPLIGALVDRHRTRIDTEDIAWALGKFKARQAVPLLIDLLREGYGTTQVACWALGMVGDERAVEPLIQEMMAPQENARTAQKAAARALGIIGYGDA